MTTTNGHQVDITIEEIDEISDWGFTETTPPHPFCIVTVGCREYEILGTVDSILTGVES